MAESRPHALEVGLVVRAVEPMLAFYRDALGMPVERELDFPGIHLWCLTAGAGVLKIVKTEAEQAGTNPPGGYEAATGLRYVSLEVDDPHASAQRASEAGGTILFEAEMPGITLALVSDPEDNQVELLRWHSPDKVPPAG